MNLLDYVKIGVAAVLGALLASGPVFFYGQHKGEQNAELKAKTEALERIQEMDKNNAKFRNASQYDRCVILLRDSGLSIDGCQRFRVSDRKVQ